jgi:hypothetical protein
MGTWRELAASTPNVGHDAREAKDGAEMSRNSPERQPAAAKCGAATMRKVNESIARREPVQDERSGRLHSAALGPDSTATDPTVRSRLCGDRCQHKSAKRKPREGHIAWFIFESDF